MPQEVRSLFRKELYDAIQRQRTNLAYARFLFFPRFAAQQIFWSLIVPCDQLSDTPLTPLYGSSDDRMDRHVNVSIESWMSGVSVWGLHLVMTCRYERSTEL